MTRLLFVGGCYDGRWDYVSKNQYNVDSYTKRDLHGKHKTFHVMVQKGISTNELIDKLIKGYKNGSNVRSRNTGS